ncbi:hypothetical protein [Alkalihalobacterium bogoriense]|uniref:hypothetical protein n=1 Tax=Alkalihalobacterium bogoriense TaxID=246272 RepID=UPI0004790FBD|nr:hypothetical protein [Alkalihalobacterium bogoriense]
MLSFIISYAVHLLAALVFFLLLPFPMLIRGTEPEGPEKLAKLFSIYKVIFMVAHGALVAAFITGIVLHFSVSLWMIAVVIVWIAIGAYLGLTAKFLRLTLEAIRSKQSYEEPLKKLKTCSMFLMLGIIAMFMTKYLPYLFS